MAVSQADNSAKAGKVERQLIEPTSNLARNRRPPAGHAPTIHGASERQFASLLNVLGATFYRCDASPPWRMSFVSRGIEALTGHRADTIAGVEWQRLMHPDDVPIVESSIEKAMQDREPFCITYRLYHATGELRWVREHGQAVPDAAGTPRFLVGMITDISEEQRLRDAGEQSRQRVSRHAAELANVLESTSDCIYSLNHSWQFTYLNRKAEAELLPSSALLGRHILEVSPQLELTAFWQTYQQVMKRREPQRIEAFMPGLDHWYEVNVAPTHDGITVFFRNIDARKQAEKEADERACQLKKTLDHIPQMVWTATPDGFHDYYSRLWYQFTGVAEGSTQGDGWSTMFHPDDTSRAWWAWTHSLKTGEPYEIEYRLRHHSGAFRWVLGRASPEKNNVGEIIRWYGTCTDIHDRVQAEGALHENRSLKQSVLDASADCIKIIMPDGTLEFMNDPGLRAMELDSLDLVRGKNWTSFWPSGDQAAVKEAIYGAQSGQARRLTGLIPTATGKAKWWDVVITPIRDEQGEVTRLLSISRDVTDHRETARQLKWTSEHDALTDLPNRRSFESHLQGAVIRAMQSGGQVALLLVDLDHFKHVNDTLGHPAGDHLLEALAKRLSSLIRATDFVARVGGDEFAIILEEDGNALDPIKAGEAIVERLRRPVIFEGRTLSAGASIGGAIFPRDAESAHDLFKSADTALYALKEEGRGGTRMFQNQMRQDAQIKSSQLNLARTAITEKSVVPHYQQKIDLKLGRVAGFEALLRWRHGTRGLQPPDTIAEAFNDYLLASKIGELMQRKVFADLERWLAQGLDVGFVAINAAPVEFLRDDFAERFLARLREFAIPPALIEVEVTEHVFLGRSSDHVTRALKELNAAGVRIALDDFGTGHSSLTHLRDFPVDVVKIDRSFVEQMPSDADVRAIVSAVIKLAHSLRIDVVAEGIETELQRQMLVLEGCRLGQGFYFGRAIPAIDVPSLLTKPSSRLAI